MRQLQLTASLRLTAAQLLLFAALGAALLGVNYRLLAHQVAVRRRRTAARTLVVVAWAMVLLRVLIGIGKRVAADSFPSAIATPTAVDHYYNHLLHLLERGLLTAALVAVVLVLVIAGTAFDVRRRRLSADHGAHALGTIAAVLVIAGWGHPWVLALTVVVTLVAVVAARRLEVRTPSRQRCPDDP